MGDIVEPLFEGKIRYCIRCCMPETDEATNFDNMGICQACRSSEQKMQINWAEREKELESILKEAKAKAGNNYDCIIPISGGKDSTFQLHVLCKVYNMKPLAVTFNHNWFSETGWYNLMNGLEVFNVDHIMFTPNRDLVNRLSKKSLHEIGDTCWHCHSGCGAFPLHIATKFNIPLLVYGEPPNEGYGMGSYLETIKYDRHYFTKVSAKKTPDQMVCEYINDKDMFPFVLPSAEDCEKVGVKGIHLGNYVFWDDERQTEFVRDTYGWMETEIEQTYKRYKSAECIMPGMHDFTCYLKRGFGRASYHATIDVRNGLLSREEGFELARKIDPIRPEALDYFLEITGMTEEEFYEVMKEKRLEPLKNSDIPIIKKETRNAERIMPFPQQIIERLKKKNGHPFHLEETGRYNESKNKWSIDGSFLDLSIGQILEGYSNKEISPVDIAKICIAQVENNEMDVMAWELYDSDRLMEQAKELEARLMKGAPFRVLEGIPVGIKDNINTIDFPTQMGSILWKGFTPGNDARVVFNLREAGAVIPGKTVTAEFAVHTLGKTLNPHDASRSPGTSSSGSAAAIATGMVPAALGSQTAGSIIRPASFCGIYGCKPSFGLIPRTGILKTTDSLDTVGFFAAYYRDLIRVFNVITVKGDNYPISHKAMTDIERQSKAPDGPWKVGLVRTPTWDYAEEYAKQSLEKWVEEIGSMSEVDIVEIELPSICDRAHEIHALIYDKTLSYYFNEEHKNAELVSPKMNEIIERGLKITVNDYQQALKDQAKLAREVDKLFESFNVAISLSTAGEAPLREIKEKPDAALLWTMAYLPVISVPVFNSPNRLPFGAQLVSRRYNDLLLFKFADYLCKECLIPEGPNPRAKY
ncbi:N-acetyl sugar amidotransferase [Thermodesulfobacteriota bacterium]